MGTTVVLLTTKEDRRQALAFEKHTILMQRQGLIDYWGQCPIETLPQSEEDLAPFDQQLQGAYVIALLTPEFLAHLGLNQALTNLLNRLRVFQEAVLVPCPVKPCRWHKEQNPFQGLTPLTRSPITQGDTDQNWVDAIGVLRRAVDPTARYS
jgi:hypothetical protein